MDNLLMGEYIPLYTALGIDDEGLVEQINYTKLREKGNYKIAIMDEDKNIRGALGGEALSVIVIDEKDRPIRYSLYDCSRDMFAFAFGIDKFGKIIVKTMDNYDKEKARFKESNPDNEIRDLTKDELKTVKRRLFKRMKILAWTNFDDSKNLAGFYDLQIMAKVPNCKTGEMMLERVQGGTDYDEYVSARTYLNDFRVWTIESLLQALSQSLCYLGYGNKEIINIDFINLPSCDPIKSYVRDVINEDIWGL